MIEWTYNDGGRTKAGFKGDTGDCGVRAIAIALELPYRQVYDEMTEIVRAWRERSRSKKVKKITMNTIRMGLYPEHITTLVSQHGWGWTPTMRVGSGVTMHLRRSELPTGRLICRVSKHYCAVLDGVIHDNHDPSRDGDRAVYGYWSRP